MLFANKQESNLRSCIKMVEEAITVLGHVPDESRLDTENVLPAWRVQKGSAQVHISLQVRDEKNFIRVTAPVMIVDERVDAVRLFRRLLELNDSQIASAAFALRGSEVILTVERTTVDLDKSEVLDMVKRIEDYADHFDDLLVNEFGGRLA